MIVVCYIFELNQDIFKNYNYKHECCSNIWNNKGIHSTTTIIHSVCNYKHQKILFRIYVSVHNIFKGLNMEILACHFS